MEIGAVYQGYVEIWRVEIEGSGGDSVHDEYYTSAQDAILASAIDGQDRHPEMHQVMKFSDGTHLRVAQKMTVLESFPITDEQKAWILERLTPAQRVLLGLKDKLHPGYGP